MPSFNRLLDADWARLAELLGLVDTRRKFSCYFSPRFAPVVLVRASYTLAASGWPRLANFFRFLNMVFFGLEAPNLLEIGPGLILPHTQGTVLGAARIGSNVTIFHQVTLGASSADYGYNHHLRPVVEDNVTIWVGAKILGPIRIGQNSTIGANAVVLQQVPPGALAVGVPARIILQPARVLEVNEL